MRKKLFSLIAALCFIIFLLPAVVVADPHLTCDPQISVKVYKITGDINETVTPLNLGDGTVKLWFELGDLPPGDYNIQVSAVYDLWGESVAIPFFFAKPTLAVPKVIRIE